MEFRILDKNFRDMVLLDRYESLLWVDRYNECGDFELYTPPTDELLDCCKIGNYIYSKTSEHLMMIEDVELTTSYEEGSRIIIKGRSIECILARRILWYKTQFRSNLEDAIRQILDYSIINPPDEDRKIDNFIFEYANDPYINTVYVNSEFDIGTDLLTVVSDICKAAHLGFKVTLNNKNQFVFKLYNGVNHSYSQVKNPWVVFSKRFENLITNEFVSNATDYKNVVRTLAVSGDGDEPIDFISYETQRQNILVLDGDERQITWENEDTEIFEFTIGKLTNELSYQFTSKIEVNEGTVETVTAELVGQSPYTRIYASGELQIQNGRISGLFKVIAPDPLYDDCYYLRVYPGVKGSITGNIITLKRPIFSVSDESFKAVGLNRIEVFNDASSVERTEEMTDDEYMAQLQYSAYETLDNNIVKTTVNGTVEDKVSYEYGVDYQIGDIVQVENEFGILGTMRVTEFITSHSTSGIEMYPTFTSTTEGET